MEAIEAENEQALYYLQGISKKYWTRLYSPLLKWGYDTSNIIKSLNGSWSDIRELPPLQLIDAIYSILIRMVS